MNWDNIVAVISVLLLIAGSFLVSGFGVRRWTLLQRLALRTDVLGSNLKNRCREVFSGSHSRKNALDLLILHFRKYREKKMDREIFESITFLRNLASIEKGRNSSTDSVLEQLSELNGLLKPIYLKTLNLLRLNRKKEAAALFAQKAGTPAARDFASLLIHWDSLEPAELMETLLSYEKSMKAVRLTEQKKKDEILSDLIYFPVVVNILVIFINFIYVAYFIDQKEMLQMFL